MGLGPSLEHAQVAQLVEHATENRSVGGSIPPLGTIPRRGCLSFNKLVAVFAQRTSDKEIVGHFCSFFSPPN